MPNSISYKEWGAVCDALGSGRQQLLLRKGGIHEGRDGFSFQHEQFWLFPTLFHAQEDQVREFGGGGGGAGEWQPGDEVPIRFFCEAQWARTLSDWEQVRGLEPFHIWTEELVRERFDCGELRQIHCALVRVFALPEPVGLTYEKKYGGCRTWVEVPLAREAALTPVVEDAEFAKLRASIEAIVS